MFEVRLLCDHAGCQERVVAHDMWPMIATDDARWRGVRLGWVKIGGAWFCPQHVEGGHAGGGMESPERKAECEAWRRVRVTSR